MFILLINFISCQKVWLQLLRRNQFIMEINGWCAQHVGSIPIMQILHMLLIVIIPQTCLPQWSVKIQKLPSLSKAHIVQRHSKLTFLNSVTSHAWIMKLANWHYILLYFILQIEAVTRRILSIKSTDPEAKILVFTSWNDVLDVLEHAFLANSISYVRMEGGR